VARRARPPRCSLWRCWARAAWAEGEGGGQTFQLCAGHAGQPQVGQLLEHGLAALGGTARLTDVRRRSGAAGELGVEGVVPAAVHGVALKRQGIQALAG
jgi:hypothetical protein